MIAPTSISTSWSRRAIVLSAFATSLSAPAASAAFLVRPRSRVIVDNDFHGDPDGLVQLAHQLLSPGADVRAIIASRLPAFTPSEDQGGQTARGVAKVAELLNVMGLDKRPAAIAGSDRALPERPAGLSRTLAADAIIREALRTDTDLPLFYLAGAGLTELARAWLLDPRIGKRITLIWIGGGEHPDLAGPLMRTEREFNLGIDMPAAQVIFEQSDITIWQVPRNAYRQLLYSHAELDRALRGCGALGQYLMDELEVFMAFAVRLQPQGLGETVILGDSPLVTLSALHASFDPDAASSRYIVRATPGFSADGLYVERSGARPMRVFTDIDARLTYGDMLAKFQRWAEGSTEALADQARPAG
jgi:hypothetical protein